jgi:hypothetical protein
MSPTNIFKITFLKTAQITVQHNQDSGLKGEMKNMSESPNKYSSGFI